MLKSLLLITLAAAVTVGLAYAKQEGTQMKIPVGKTSPTSGQQMYRDYCAPCHGLNGKGNGPAAPALRTPPTDLTRLSEKNNGKFPDAHIAAVVQFGANVPAHGSAEMPVWGPILSKMDRGNPQDLQLRVSNLSRYIESLQAK